MTIQHETVLTAEQLELLQTTFHHGAAACSVALAKWLGKPTQISVDAVEQLSLHEATGVLGVGEDPMCFCCVEMTGRLTGAMILAFDDASGLALADMLLDQPRGTAREWGEMETSAALETTNILCCAYLNSLAKVFPAPRDGTSELIPLPPRFSRDFAASLIQFALMGQAVATDHVFLTRTQFQIEGSPVNWNLLFVPDADSMSSLRNFLTPERTQLDNT